MPVVKRKIARAKSKAKKALAKASKKPVKNPSAYFECLKSCCQQGIKPKKISQIAHECKTNALAIKAKMSYY